MGKLDKVYARSPVWLQNALVSSYGLYWHWARFGGNYEKFEDAFHHRESFSQQQWQEYQDQELKKVLKICFEHVPYYRDHWSSQEIAAAIAGEVTELPLLEKNVLRLNSRVFWREDMDPFPKLIFHTSGTTGTPIATRFTLSEFRKSLAIREARSVNWAGTSFKEARATFSGRMVEPDPNSDDHIYRYNAVEKQVYFSAFHLKPSTAYRYVDALYKHKVIWMTGYAVSFFLLGRFILDQGLKVPPLKAIITTSEKLTPDMRAVMEQAYGCRVYEEYSTVESALFASECEHGRLHISPDVGIVEILRPDGTQCEPGEVGEVVATCLFRTYQPLIRFRLGDLAAWDPNPCPCGRQMPVIKEVVGRLEEVVTGPDGRQLVRFHGIFTDQPNVIEGQIIQETLHEFVVKLVPTPTFSEDDEKDVIARMHQRLGDDVHITIEKVGSIPRSVSGKFVAVISKVK